ncbi:delta 9-fatty acid desaturase protein [Exidia glandulosa HHB12029]|uniref:Acyl-CoA desaturase n=1 Tax=Exidia glandulosa HHB12029 TaxID=1314781 RepID=A0A165JCD3_EXIGL|nr:delta 9-fatty acid desaturase protein [Exidia glandulosa HHB12029]
MSESVITPPLTPRTEATELNVPAPPVTRTKQNYVEHVLESTPALPPITWANWYREINWLSLSILTIAPAIAVYGCLTTSLRLKTAFWSFVYYYVTGFGITAGYHRLWAHRSYSASKALEWFLAFAGAGAVEGSIRWWARGHRAHHRYTDTDLDPYSAHKGLLWSHIGWMVVLPRRKPGAADVSDLAANPIVAWQHRNYLWLLLLMGFVVPTAVAGFGWGDWRGGFFYAAATRLVFLQHSTFCVNSLAHYLGSAPFDDKHTPRDHVVTALLTFGEGYHNFHHQFPSDYRNAIRWFQYDPTKWFIRTCQAVGLASHLKTFPDNEIQKGELTMELKKLKAIQDAVTWPKDASHLPVVTWEHFQEQARHRPLILVTGFIHDVAAFLDHHPGGRHILASYIGKDATTAFFGGVKEHSNAAHNLLAMMRVGVLRGGLEVETDKVAAIPPSQRLKIVEHASSQ